MNVLDIRSWRKHPRIWANMRIFRLAFLAIVVPSLLSAQASSPRVSVTVDPRIELMSVVQLINDYSLVTRYDSPYKQDAERYFAPFASHPAVTLFGQMSEAGFAFSHVPNAMLSFTEPPTLAPRVPFDPLTLEAAGGEEDLLQFIQALRDFVSDAGFMEFFRSHQSSYGLAVEDARTGVQQAVTVLEAYTGMQLENSTVVLGFLLHNGGFAALYEPTFGEWEAVAFIGPEGTVDGLPDFGDAGRMLSLVGHEFAHLIVNPLTAEHRDAVQRYAVLHEPIAEAMRRLAYPTWNETVYEHIVRAITVRIMYRERGDEAGREALDTDLERGFVYLPQLVERLEEYERQRDRYPTFADFYPRLIDVFDEALEEVGR